MEYLSRQELSDLLNKTVDQVLAGRVYFHYKNHDKQYLVLHIGIDKSTMQPCVIYQSTVDHCIWVRPLSSWLEMVDYNGSRVRRFQLVTK
jgi:hypothetical protein